MSSTTWHIQGIDTDGHDLVLSQIQPWSASGEEIPLSITSTFPPTSGSLDDLLIADSTECVFAAADVQKPGFAIVFTFNAAVDLWGFRFAGPSPTTWPLQHTLGTGVQAATLPQVRWSFGSLSPAPTRRPSFTRPIDAWVSAGAAGSKSWRSCAASGDGQVLLAGSDAAGGGLLLSKDAGETWVVTEGSGPWTSCAVSRDGQVLLAGGGWSGGQLYVSKDGGETWSAQTTLGGGAWRSCSVSWDGQAMLAATEGSNYLWLSKDGGETWVAQQILGAGSSFYAAASGDGQVLIVVAANENGVLVSKDGGETWTQHQNPWGRDLRCLAVSEDGSVVLAGTGNGRFLWVSKDSGETWSAQTELQARDWRCCAVSEGGQVMLAGAEGSELLALSKDGGATWATQTALQARDWRCCAVSGDGQVLLAGVPGAASLAKLWLYCAADPIYQLNTPRTYTPPVAVAVQGLPPDAQGALNTYAAEAVQFNDLEFSGNGRVYGTVERKNTPTNVPLRRRVRLHRSRDGMLVRETWSKPDGSYEFKHVSMHYEYDAIAWDHEMSYRSVIANNLKPEAM